MKKINLTLSDVKNSKGNSRVSKELQLKEYLAKQNRNVILFSIKKVFFKSKIAIFFENKFELLNIKKNIITIELEEDYNNCRIDGTISHDFSFKLTGLNNEIYLHGSIDSIETALLMGLIEKIVSNNIDCYTEIKKNSNRFFKNDFLTENIETFYFLLFINSSILKENIHEPIISNNKILEHHKEFLKSIINEINELIIKNDFLYYKHYMIEAYISHLTFYNDFINLLNKYLKSNCQIFSFLKTTNFKRYEQQFMEITNKHDNAKRRFNEGSVHQDCYYEHLAICNKLLRSLISDQNRLDNY